MSYGRVSYGRTSYGRTAPATAGAVVTTRPSGTVSAGTWTPVGAATLHAAVNDESDTTYAQSSTGAADDTAELSWPAEGAPGAGPVTFYIRHRKA